MAITKEQLLAEVDDLLRSMPPRATIRHDTVENWSWLGRVSAVIEEWQPAKGIFLNQYLEKFQSVYARDSDEGLRRLLILLHQVRQHLRLETVGPMNVAIPQGSVFDYFDELRKIIEGAKQEVYFIDPWLDAEFVPRYLPQISAGVAVRLLTTDKRLPTLLPAIDAFAQQYNVKVEVRSTPGIHYRYVFIDKSECYQSGASFKDGAKKAPTTLTQITDAFGSMLQTYENLWAKARVER